MKSGERPIMPHVVRAQCSIMTRRCSSSSLVRGMMKDNPTRSPLDGDTYVISSRSAGSCCMSYSAATARTPLRKPGWVVTSSTRSPRSQTSRSCSCKPLMYCCPVRAGIAPLLAAGELPRGDLLRGQVLIPRAREMAEFHQVFSEQPLVPGPLAPRQLVGHLHTIAIRISEVNPDGNAVVRHPLDGYTFVLQPLVELLQVLQAPHHPGHVIQPHPSRPRAGSLCPYLNQRDLVRLFQVSRHEGHPAGPAAISMQPQHVRIPLLGALRVPHEHVHVPQILRPVAHFVLLCSVAELEPDRPPAAASPRADCGQLLVRRPCQRPNLREFPA